MTVYCRLLHWPVEIVIKSLLFQFKNSQIIIDIINHDFITFDDSKVASMKYINAQYWPVVKTSTVGVILKII